MSAGAIGLALDERGTAAGFRSRDGFSGDAINLQHVVAVDRDPRDAIGRAARADIRIAARIRRRHFGGVLVVLADEQNGQLPDAGHVERFVERAVVDRSVAEEGRSHCAVLEDLRAVSAAAGLQHTRADDAARSHHADLGREEMHAAAASARTAGFAAKQLRHQLARRHAFRERVAMSAMSGEDRIVLRQMSTDTGRNRLLANIRVTRSVDEAALMTAREFFFRLPNDLHRPIEGEDSFVRQVVVLVHSFYLLSA